MKDAKRNHAAEFKSRLALEALRDRYSPQELADRFGVHVSLVHAWRRQLRDSLPALFGENAGGREKGESLRRIERHIEELRNEQEWMRAMVSKYIDMHSRRKMVNPDDETLSIVRQAALLGLHRSGLYYEKSKARSKKYLGKTATNVDMSEKAVLSNAQDAN